MTPNVSDLAKSDSRSRFQSQPRPPVIRPKSELVALDARRASAANGLGRTPVSWGRPARTANSESDQEVIIIVRSKSDPAEAQAITVSDPGPKLLDYLKTMESNGARATRQLDMAQMRELN